MDTVFERLLRFEDDAGHVHYGEAPAGVMDPARMVGMTVPRYEGTVPWSSHFRLSSDKSEIRIAKVLSPLAETPVFQCIGLNYRRHISEAKLPTPSYPPLFLKTSDALNGPLDDVTISKTCPNVDYEGEICVIIGKDFRDLSDDENPLDYVLGYTVGNDVSSRYWQAAERSSHQASYAKSFDGFAPIGPVVVSARAVPNVTALTMTTRVNGELRQQTGIEDLLFDVPTILRFLSQGHTVRAGTVVMTGTPSGVGMAQVPPSWLSQGDVVEVEIDKIGVIRNKFRSE